MNYMLPIDLRTIAQFSPCRNWRYTLHRDWADGEGVAFLMFNPSTADERQDDPTIRKCIGFAKRWGYGRLLILNLFAIRGTDPRVVRRVSDPIGPLNDYWIRKESLSVREVVCAWGCSQHMKGELAKRPRLVLEHILQENVYDMRLSCLGYSADRSPRHPLMLSYDTPRERFEIAEKVSS